MTQCLLQSAWDKPNRPLRQEAERQPRLNR